MNGRRDIFVISGTARSIPEMAAEHRLDPRSVVPDSDRRISRTWGIHTKPFLVALDRGGVVQSRGRVYARKDLSELLGVNVSLPEGGSL